jgi:catechol 2,3-dioxygenase-like lactoylglutathione lyase family enzyme
MDQTHQDQPAARTKAQTLARLEHVNISVRDAERAANFLAKLTGWERRWEGPARDNGWVIHLGSEEAYLAIYTHQDIRGDNPKGQPLNHIGLQVTDLAVAEAIVVAEGLTPFNHSDYQPGPKSFYFFDHDGIEFEVVCYE